MASQGDRRLLRRGALIAGALAVVALVLPPFINVSRYKNRVIESMSRAFGRSVTCDSIELRVLPRPGFYLANVAIGDDPAFGMEPILHADEVTAYLRLSSLWRGRMEISRVYLNYPSLNLAERGDGSWNFESLLWNAAKTQTSPTSAPLSASYPRFPYIEASNGRINFKNGLEKSAFSFLNANFTLWSPAENEWRMRLEAQPVRTDMPITDTGIMKAEATMRRAAVLRDAPVKIGVTWERAQLGNLTRLIYGEDWGWRGALETSAQFFGTPSALHFVTAAKLRDFRRFDIAGSDEVDLSATCEGDLNVGANQLQRSECNLPLEGGRLSIQGTFRDLHSPRYDLALSAHKLGANALLSVVRHTMRNLPDDLRATGTLSAAFHVSRPGEAPPDLTGHMELDSLVLQSSVLGKNLAIKNAVFTAGSQAPPASARRGHSKPVPPPVRGLVLESFDLPLGAATPAKVEGALDGERFALHVKGDAGLERLQQYARAFGIGAPKFSLSGPAAMDVVIGGTWATLDAPLVTGSAQLKNVRAEVPGLAFPVEVSSGRVELTGDRFTVRDASATVGKVSLGGSASFPLSCDSDSDCQATFDLSTDELNPARWNEVLNPHFKKTPWYVFGGTESGSNVLSGLRATGHMAARRLNLDTISGTGFETNFSLVNGVLDLKDTRANLLGGAVSGDWNVDFTGSEPKCFATGTAARIQVEKLTPVLKASLGSGTLDLRYTLHMSGWDTASLATSATGEADYTWKGGALRISPDPPSPLRVLSGEGRAVLDKAGWSISGSEWRTPGGLYQLSGTVSRTAALKLEFSQPDSGAVWQIGGTLAKPQTGGDTPQPTRAARR